MSVLGWFSKDRRGNVAALFGLGMIPIAMGLAAAVDYSRASSMTAQLRSAVDAGAIAGVQESDRRKGEQRAREIVEAQLARGKDVSGVVVTPTWLNERELKVEAQLKLKNSFGGLLPRDTAVGQVAVASLARSGRTVTININYDYSDAFDLNRLYVYVFDKRTAAFKREQLAFTNERSFHGPVQVELAADEDFAFRLENVHLGLKKPSSNGKVRSSYSNPVPKNLKVTGTDCRTERVTHNWEDRPGEADLLDHNDFVYSYTCAEAGKAAAGSVVLTR